MVQGYMNFVNYGIKNVHKLILNRETSISKLCRESLQNIDNSKHLNSFITICHDEVLTRAQQLDERLTLDHNEAANQPLFGCPVSIKDNFCLQNVLTTCGSKMLHNFRPPYTATAVQKLLDAGCVITGKTNMDEFAMGSSSTTSYFGPTASSWMNNMSMGDKPSQSNAHHWFMAGGSSTGSAISVASGACFASLSTDTGGSTRQPASLAGIVGFKPTYGLISRFGLIPLAHCLDVVSIMTRNAVDAGIIFDTIVGQDENDLTTVDDKTMLKSDFGDNKPKIIRVGVPEEFIEKGDLTKSVSDQFDKVLKCISADNDDFKLELVKLSLPNSSLATECYTIISSAEIASNMSCYDGVKYGYSKDPSSAMSESLETSTLEFDRDKFFKNNRDESFGSEVKKRILLGNYFLLEENREKYFGQALKLRRLISDEFERAFEDAKIDIMVTPSTPNTSCSYKDWLNKQDNNRLFHEDYFLIPANLANLPSISIPAGLSDNGLPIGLQVIAKRYYDRDLLKLSQMFEKKISETIVK